MSSIKKRIVKKEKKLNVINARIYKEDFVCIKDNLISRSKEIESELNQKP